MTDVLEDLPDEILKHICSIALREQKQNTEQNKEAIKNILAFSPNIRNLKIKELVSHKFQKLMTPLYLLTTNHSKRFVLCFEVMFDDDKQQLFLFVEYYHSKETKSKNFNDEFKDVFAITDENQINDSLGKFVLYFDVIPNKVLARSPIPKASIAKYSEHALYRETPGHFLDVIEEAPQLTIEKITSFLQGFLIRNNGYNLESLNVKFYERVSTSYVTLENMYGDSKLTNTYKAACAKFNREKVGGNNEFVKTDERIILGKRKAIVYKKKGSRARFIKRNNQYIKL